MEGDVYYEVCKDIPQGMELLVWYGDCYLQFMGVPVALKEMAGGGAAEEADSKCPTLFDFFLFFTSQSKKIIYIRTGLSVLNQFETENKVSCLRTQCDQARIRNPSTSSQALYH